MWLSITESNSDMKNTTKFAIRGDTATLQAIGIIPKSIKISNTNACMRYMPNVYFEILTMIFEIFSLHCFFSKIFFVKIKIKTLCSITGIENSVIKYS